MLGSDKFAEDDEKPCFCKLNYACGGYDAILNTMTSLVHSESYRELFSKREKNDSI